MTSKYEYLEHRRNPDDIPDKAVERFSSKDIQQYGFGDLFWVAIQLHPSQIPMCHRCLASFESDKALIQNKSVHCNKNCLWYDWFQQKRQNQHIQHISHKR
jgi:hypothetical protein